MRWTGRPKPTWRRPEPTHPYFQSTGMRVLLVEDDRMIAEAMERGLRDAAYAVDRVR